MKCLKGNPVSDGIAIGPIYIYKPLNCDVGESFFDAPEALSQLARYASAVATARAELSAIVSKLSQSDPEKAKIFVAHQEILEDEELDEEIQNAITEELNAPEYAVYKVYSMFSDLLSGAPDPLIAARAADLKDVRGRLVRILRGEKEKNLSNLPSPVIIAAHDILPSDTATLDRDNVLGIITETGGATSHSAIIARSYQIPAVLGVPDATKVLNDGGMCVLDALEGEIFCQPDEDVLEHYEARRTDFLNARKITQEFSGKDACLADGLRILTGLNIGSDEDSPDYSNCDFIGLFRTEFLYMHSDHLPTEDEQYLAYTRVLKNAKGRTVTLRTLDIGGDKTLSYMPLPKEDNPFLGCRALRLCLKNPEIFNTQLRGALRASACGPMQIMFPMVASIDDIRRAKKAVEKAKDELRREGLSFDENIKLGIMIEIPSIAEIIDLAVKEVDFASVGTNDLTQYMHAVDRMNPEITNYYQSFSPSMFRILGRIFKAFNREGKPVSVCGELAGDPLAAPVLVGLGLRKLSMSGSNIAKVKQALSRFTLSQTEEMAKTVCSLPTQEEILSCLKHFSR